MFTVYRCDNTHGDTCWTLIGSFDSEYEAQAYAELTYWAEMEYTAAPGAVWYEVVEE